MRSFTPYRATSRWRILAVVGLFSGGGFAIFHGQEPATVAEIDNRVPVQVALAQPAPDADAISAYGVVRPDREAKLAFKIGGMIRAVTVDAGDRVRKGQVLAELDTSEIDSRASLAALAVEKAQRDVNRLTPLGQKGYASAQHVADARTALDGARADQRAVEFDRSLAHITAPVDGVVLARHAEGREMVSPGAPILTVSSGTDSFVLKVGLSDRDMARVKVGDPAIIRLDAFDRAELQGRVARLAAESDPRSGTFEAEISFDDLDRPLVSGFMGQVQIQPEAAGPSAAAVSIPASAILEGHGSQASVFLVNPQTGQVERRRLTVGRLRGENILVTGGLSPDSVIVTAGAAYLHEGASVRITEDLAALK
ncbi:MAG: efflux RND transporter periplasmic adaptor subunit [Pseudomonadota bacterium]